MQESRLDIYLAGMIRGLQSGRNKDRSENPQHVVADRFAMYNLLDEVGRTIQQMQGSITRDAALIAFAFRDIFYSRPIESRYPGDIIIDIAAVVLDLEQGKPSFFGFHIDTQTGGTVILRQPTGDRTKDIRAANVDSKYTGNLWYLWDGSVGHLEQIDSAQTMDYRLEEGPAQSRIQAEDRALAEVEGRL